MSVSRDPVFLSYRRDDEPIVAQIQQGLTQAGINARRDRDIIVAGDKWDSELARCIQTSRVLIVVVSENTVKSPKQVRRELVMAEELNIPIVPVRVDDANWGEAFAFLLERVHYIDFRKPIENAISELAAAVSRRLTEPADTNPPRDEISPQATTLPAPDLKGLKVTLLYRRGEEPDRELLLFLESKLTPRGADFYCDRKLKVGAQWAREIEDRVRNSDVIIPLLSANSVKSEMLAFELKIVEDEQQKRKGLPRILPVRIGYQGPLPSELEGILGGLQYVLWNSASDNEVVLAKLVQSILNPPGQLTEDEKRMLQMPTGAVPLESQFYVKRAADGVVDYAIQAREGVILVKGARQMGKTSLVARTLRKAREQGMRTCLLDLQKLNRSDLADLKSFYIALADHLRLQLKLGTSLRRAWDEESSPNGNLEAYLIDQVLGPGEQPLLWVLDEVDRLFTCDFGTEVFALIRSWQNDRSDPGNVFRRLSTMISFATEPSLFIKDLNQSPFNVGLDVMLEDFDAEQVAELNRRYGSPLKSSELDAFMYLLGGQPFLVRRALHEMVVRTRDFAQISANAARSEGIFGDHLGRFYVVLLKDDEMFAAMRAFVMDRKLPSHHEFYRLRSSGLLRGENHQEAAIRCRLYQTYFESKLA